LCYNPHPDYSFSNQFIVYVIIPLSKHDYNCKSLERSLEKHLSLCSEFEEAVDLMQILSS